MTCGNLKKKLGPTACKPHMETMQHNHSGSLLSREEERCRNSAPNFRNTVGTAHHWLRNCGGRTSVQNPCKDCSKAAFSKVLNSQPFRVAVQPSFICC